MWNLTKSEQKLFKSLNSANKVQDFLDKLKFNFEQKGETLRSPREVIKSKSAHCIEGAIFSAAVFWYHHQQPLLMDITSANYDYDHVVCLFKSKGRWGATSKTNHNVLRFRDPVYSSPKELAMSYFHEYFWDDGIKTMRSYSKPFNLNKFGSDWVTSDRDLWAIGDALDKSKHVSILNRSQMALLRKASKIEINAGKLTEWKKELN